MATVKKKSIVKLKRMFLRGLYISSQHSTTLSCLLQTKQEMLLAWSSSGHLKFKGSRKVYSYAAQMLQKML